MKSSFMQGEIIGAILDTVAKKQKTRVEIADAVAKKLLSDKRDGDLNGSFNTLRVEIFVLLDELVRKQTVALLKDGTYTLREGKKNALRKQSCEEELLKLLSGGALNKEQIKSSLAEIFETQKTATKRDDNTLHNLISDTLKRLSKIGVIEFSGGKYRIVERKSAMADNLIEIASLKADFLTLLHSRGGEFFEYYFMNLLSKYLKKSGIRVNECTVSGGADDGGIDGIIKTTDALGFREIIMVQTKNRTEPTSELDVRGFWGAVSAMGGTRGVYATTASFYPTAEKFIDGLDNCIAIDGDEIFALAKELEYGIKNTNDTLTVDTEVI